MSVKTLLDDAAAEATAGLRIDLARARWQADERRARLRHRAGLVLVSAVAMAAVIALIAVLIPRGAFRAVTPVPASSGTPTGLPERWFYAPPWTPPVTRHPMAAASLVLSTPLNIGGGAAVDGPVLVSANGTQYASLPWSRWDSLVALSADGREVGWISQRRGSAGGPKDAVAHIIRLSDGRRWEVNLPAGVSVSQLAWADGRLFYSGKDKSAHGYSGMAFDTGDDPSGRHFQVPPPELTPSSVPFGSEVLLASDNSVASAFTVVDPGSTRTAEAVRSSGSGQSRFSVRISGVLGTKGQAAQDVFIPITATEPISDLRILAWATGGIVVRVRSHDPVTGNSSVSLRLVAPDGSGSRIVSRKGATLAYPVAVASDVVAGGNPVVAGEPKFSSTDRSHFAFLWGMAWREYAFGLWAAMLIGLTGTGLLLVGLRRRRVRRRAKDHDGRATR